MSEVPNPNPQPEEGAILTARDVWVGVKVGKVIKPIVQGGRLTVPQGGILGLVGESGSGKTQFVRAMMGLSSLEPGVFSGSATYKIGDQPAVNVLDEIHEHTPFRPPRGDELFPQRERIGFGWPLWRRRFRKRLDLLRRLGVGFIFQNPTGALNPFLTVGTQLKEAVLVAKPNANAKEAQEGALHWLDQVHLKADLHTLQLYPHELSGGMAQRVMIALALAGEPKFIVADEPTTGLDSHIRLEIVGLLNRIMGQGALSGIVISHDLPMVARLCDRLTVMYRGRVVEEGPIEALGDPSSDSHPYTRELKERAEALARGRQKHSKGGVEKTGGTGVVVGKGCIYRARCSIYRDGLVDKELCNKVQPQMNTIADRHKIACHSEDIATALEQSQGLYAASGGSNG